MSTRCNILFEMNGKYDKGNPNNGYKYNLYYRHWDGYPTVTGLDLVQLMLKFIEDNEPDDIKSLYDVDTWLRTNLTHQYEKFQGGEVAGDIEWLYVVNFNNGVTITAYQREDLNDNVEKWKDWESQIIFRAEEILGPGSPKSCYDLKKIYIESDI